MTRLRVLALVAALGAGFVPGRDPSLAAAEENDRLVRVTLSVPRMT